ncbi:MAG TPA: DedA family protein [Verrucomicrobiae bacterium]|nr:DedA family protein [Verrucomicrobiae bacterium]
MFKAFLQPLVSWYFAALKTWGAAAVGAMMVLESTVVPIPSEVVVPPAAHWAHTGQLPISLWQIVLAGAIGSWLGASIMYWASRLAGRPLVMRYGKYFFVPPQKIEGAENWSAHYGGIGIFISRVLPVVRHLIGIPAGIVRMNYWIYSVFTLLGSAIWCGVLCYVGIKAGQDQKLLKGELHHVALWLGGAAMVLGGLYYFFVHRHLKKK